MVRLSNAVVVVGMIAVVAPGCGPAPKRPLAPERDAPEHAASVTTGTPLASSPGLPPPPVGFATSDLVTMMGGELSAWAIADGKLVKTGTATIAKIADDEQAVLDGVGHGDWADRDHLFVTVGAREVVMITPQAITRVAMPTDRELDAPKPADPQGDLTSGGDSAAHGGTGLVISEGAAAWSRCAWGLPYDGFQCELWVHVQLWPTRERREAPQSLGARAWAWPAAPAGYTAKATDKAVACSGPKVKTQIPAGTEDDLDESIESVHWVSAEPPRLLVSYGHMGYADVLPERWTLHEGCIIPPLASGSTATPGPAGLWLAAASDGHGPVLYRGAKIIGELPDTIVMLRPPR